MKVLVFVILLAGCWFQKEEGVDVSNATAPPAPPVPPAILNIDNGSLDNITSYNASTFLVRGNCNLDGGIVKVIAENIRPRSWSKCFDGNFKAILDLSSINKDEVTIEVSLKSVRVTATVKNSFICPKNYVPVPRLGGYSNRDFCVAKYEAKKDSSDIAISSHEGKPWTGQTLEEQIKHCKDNGPNFDLIKNDEWQTIARNIEREPKNWGAGVVGSGLGINTGVNNLDKNNGPLSASDNLSNSCYGTGNECTEDSWHPDKRTHVLSNGMIIWDISGNVMERLKDDNRTDYATYPINEKPTVTHMTPQTYKVMGCMSGGPARLASGHFGPAGSYTGLKRFPFGGLGVADFTNTPLGVSRGGHWFQGVESGVFAVSTNEGLDTRKEILGFRCVYNP